MTNTIKKTFSSLDTTLITGIITNLALSMILGLSMKYLWNLINTLQIITHIPMLNISLPANLLICLKTIIEVSNLSIIPRSLIDSLFNSIDEFN